MAKKAISVTLQADNLTWLKGRVAAEPVRSISEFLDRLIAEARSTPPAHVVRSVVGTIEIASQDSLLRRADRAIREDFDRSLRRPPGRAMKAGAGKKRRG